MGKAARDWWATLPRSSDRGPIEAQLSGLGIRRSIRHYHGPPTVDPLKLQPRSEDGRGIPHYHGPPTVDPLKPQQLKERFAALRALPRSSDRGPIEAKT